MNQIPTRNDLGEDDFFDAAPADVRRALDAAGEAPLHIHRPSRRGTDNESLVVLPAHIYYLLICAAADFARPGVDMASIDDARVLRDLAGSYPHAGAPALPRPSAAVPSLVDGRRGRLALPAS